MPFIFFFLLLHVYSFSINSSTPEYGHRCLFRALLASLTAIKWDENGGRERETMGNHQSQINSIIVYKGKKINILRANSRRCVEGGRLLRCVLLALWWQPAGMVFNKLIWIFLASISFSLKIPNFYRLQPQGIRLHHIGLTLRDYYKIFISWSLFCGM